ncbi:MAG: hypothetical protein RR319_00970 [Bacteroides sp.]
MNELIKRLANRLKIQYACFLAFSSLICLSFECGLLNRNFYLSDVRITYILETVGIICTLAVVPITLKLYGRFVNNKLRNLSLVEGMNKYKKMYLSLLFMFESVLLLDIYVYYATSSNVGAFCAFIILVATLLCVPTKKRIVKELDLDEDNEKSEEE